MTQHFVYYYGSTRITASSNPNQIISFDGVDKNLELSEFGEICLQKQNSDGFYFGETGTMYPKENISIVPFRYHWCTIEKESIILKHLEDVIDANEKYIKSESIGFPLLMLSAATQKGYSLLGKGTDLSAVREKEMAFQNQWCCFGHYYLYLLKKALIGKGYTASGVSFGEKNGNLINKVFRKEDGTRLIIHADAGM